MRDWHKRFKLTRKEFTLLIMALTGIYPPDEEESPDSLSINAHVLASELEAAAIEAQIDFERYGMDLTGGPDNGKQRASNLKALSQKVSVMRDEEAIALWYFSAGFVSGNTYASQG